MLAGGCCSPQNAISECADNRTKQETNAGSYNLADGSADSRDSSICTRSRRPVIASPCISEQHTKQEFQCEAEPSAGKPARDGATDCAHEAADHEASDQRAANRHVPRRRATKCYDDTTGKTDRGSPPGAFQ